MFVRIQRKLFRIAVLVLENSTQTCKLSTRPMVASENVSRNCLYNIIPKPLSLGTQQEKKDHQSIFSEVVNNFVEESSQIPEIRERYRTLLYKNVPCSAGDAGFFSVIAYKALEESINITQETKKLANIVGWCATLHFSYRSIIDDIMNNMETRNGKPCWYKQPGVGTQAVNDSMVILNGINLVIRKYFSNETSYYPLLENFHDVTMKLNMGQTLLVLHNSGVNKIDWYTKEKYNKLAKYKGIYPNYFLPITLGFHLTKNYDDRLASRVNEFLEEISCFSMAQSDILNYYGSNIEQGLKDIQDGKCTWLAVEAFEKASPAQKELLKKHYGKEAAESEMLIRTVYEDLGLLDIFLKYEKSSFDNACRIVTKMPEAVQEKLFSKIIDSTYDVKNA